MPKLRSLEERRLRLPNPRSRGLNGISGISHQPTFFRTRVGRNQVDFGLDSESSDEGNQDDEGDNEDDDLKVLETAYSRLSAKVSFRQQADPASFSSQRV